MYLTAANAEYVPKKRLQSVSPHGDFYYDLFIISWESLSKDSEDLCMFGTVRTRLTA